MANNYYRGGNMKKLLLIILAIIYTVKVNAYELTYSEWSEEYPEGIEEILIRKEDRYLCYIDKEVNEEYLIKEEIGNKKVDYNDFIFSKESELLDDKPEEFEDRVINEKEMIKTYTEDDVNGILIYNTNTKNDYYISEVRITDLEDNPIELISNDSYRTLYDNDLTTGIKMVTSIKFNFKNNVNVNNIKFKMNIKASDPYPRLMNFNYISNDNYLMYRKNITSLNNEVFIEGETDFNENLSRKVTKYTYVDKLYRTYEIETVEGDQYKKRRL